MPLTSRSHRNSKSTAAAGADDRGGLLLPSLGVKKGKTSAGRRERTHPFFSGRNKYDFAPLVDAKEDKTKNTTTSSGATTSTKQKKTQKTFSLTKGSKSSGAAQSRRTPLSPARSLHTVTTAESSGSELSPTGSSHAQALPAKNPASAAPSSPSINAAEPLTRVNALEEKVNDTWDDTQSESVPVDPSPEEAAPEAEDGDECSVTSMDSIKSNFAETVLKLVEDCESRWNSFIGKPSKSVNTLPTTSDESSASYAGSAGVLVPRVLSEQDSVASQIIMRQQAEIEYLRARVERQEQLLQERTLALPAPPPVEEIDALPMEEVELVLDDQDVVSVTSFITHIHDVRDETVALAMVPISRPDAATDEEDDDVGLPSTRVQDYPLQLRAANGSVRNALYTGPCKRGSCTGVGVLRFETEDVYMGEVMNGKMHGNGTYTFAKQRRGKPKVLRGVFENNVYMGWNPDALRRKHT